MGVTKTLQAATGWLELGIADEALHELVKLPMETRHQREALELQLAAQMVNQACNSAADTARRNLWGWFPEIAALQGKCSFANCTHINEKSCAVLTAVERGEIHPRRQQSYVRIYETLPQ